MKSIRLYLLLALIAIITLVNFVSLLHGYQSSISEVQKLFDSRLKSMAQLIAVANTEATQTAEHREQQAPYVYFQIWSKESKQLITRSSNAPITALSSLDPGFYDTNFNSYRWRNYVYSDVALNRWIVVSERSDIRYELAERVVLESVFPIILGIPVAALIIWLAVGVGLRPLREVAKQLTKKQADDLSPIRLDATPKELVKLVETTNDLFRRLDNAFQREQQFAADAAHELRTPISELKVHSHNLQRTLGDNDEVRLLSASVEKTGHLIEQILALYRSSPDQASVKFSALDLYSLAQDLIAQDYDYFENKQQTIALLGEKSPMYGNAFALQTLLHNLISNAHKYTPTGGTVQVDINHTKDGVCLIVEDSGSGIPPQQYQHVFERFYRLDGDRHDSGTSGCGLGLAIVKHIVNLHQASILLGPSRFDSGLKVTINFPKMDSR